MFGRLLYFGMLLLGGVLIVSAQEVKEGLRVTFSPKGESKVLDAVVLPNVRLYVPAGEAATPLMKPGPFTATWSGFLTLEMRSQYAFQAESSGAVKVDLNGSTVLEVAEGSKEVTPGKVVRLNKGTNQITVVFTAPASGDAFLRLYWIPKDALPTPLPDVGFNHLPDAELLQHLAIHQGRGLFLEHRCGKCHLPGMMGDTAELQMDAPTFSGIGSRRNFAWMRDWILDPKKQRATARMPRIFHGPEAAADATAVAAYLASLKVESGSPSGTKGTAEQIESGKKRFEALHCAACHTSPEESQVDVARPSLAHVRAKFPEGELARFILKPEAHYAWTRMPRFKLSEAQAAELAAYLESKAVEPATASADAGLVEKGRKLVQSSGCINCHTAELENQFKTKALADIPASRWNQGCVTKSEKSPHFGFSPEQVKALVAFAETDRESLSRHVDREFASRQSLNLRCVECHGKFEGFPH
ncbi:MAG: c-type cytochrome, partial [Verrucomicrobiota bacterium]|nr:c-type cytochrome [Verrucomicrobiota bacterium]